MDRDGIGPRRPVCEFSIVTDPARWRQGYEVSLLRALLAYPPLAGVPVFEAGIEPENVASRRLVERAGFTVRDDTPDREGMLTYRLDRASHASRDPMGSHRAGTRDQQLHRPCAQLRPDRIALS